MKNNTVHMVGNAHIDPVWLWQWQEGCSEVLATCRSALDRMNETPEFIFSRSSSAAYRWIEESSPEVFEEIRRRVDEGRWNIVNGWIEQPDCNIPSGESFVRHSLYGKRYFLDRFGIEVLTGWNVDSFGHNAGLPQILSLAGFKYYIFFRPNPQEKDLAEPLFWWEGPAGSRVLACRPPGHYLTRSDELVEQVQRAVAWMPRGVSHSICFYGIGNHGGGPSKLNIESIKAIDADPDCPRVIFSTPERFFEAILSERTDFPTLRGDLQHHAVGCYTSHSTIKKDNRRCELLLGRTEKFATLASRELGREYPVRDFQAAWEAVLFQQFHDILAGSSTFEAYEDARDAHGFAAWTASGHLNASLQSFAERVDTSGEGSPIVVFNPLPWPVKQPVEYASDSDELSDDASRPVASQPDGLAPLHTRFGRPNIFVADLPPLGWRIYHAGTGKPVPGGEGLLSADERFLENDWWRIEVDADGAVSQVRDRRRGLDVLSGPVAAIVLDDPSDTWSHGSERYDAEIGRFRGGNPELMESGPVRAAVRATSSYGDSTMVQDVLVYRDLDVIEWRISIDWHEKQRLLKLSVPLAMEAPQATCGAAYAAAERDTEGLENPFQQWIDVSGRIGRDDYGLALLCEGKYGFDVRGSAIRLTLLRSPAYAMHEPMRVEPGNLYRFLDKGEHQIRFRLVPHPGDWRPAGVPRLAATFANPATPVISSSHPGKLKPSGSFLSIEPENVILGALKVAEDGEDLIVRLYESEGRATAAQLRIGLAAFDVEIDAHELKTLLVSLSGDAAEVDLLERPV